MIARLRRCGQQHGMRYGPAENLLRLARHLAATRTGLTLGLDAIDQGINRLASNPAAAASVPELRRRLAQARSLTAAAANR